MSGSKLNDVAVGVTGPQIALQSLVETHDRPFCVIDSHYRIHAVNRAFEQRYGVSSADAVGQYCYRVNHNNEVPCHELGEVCLHRKVLETGKPDACLQIHHDADEHLCQVRIRAFPLPGSDGEMYLGEQIEEISPSRQCAAAPRKLVGTSSAFLNSLEQLHTAAAADVPVLLFGETGTGKELAAHFIHDHSRRRDKPFKTVDCTVLTETLFEAELFGHVRGAFTGSVGDRVGLFEQADGGTLFLDELGELPLTQQVKLLRALESGQFRRVGGRRVRRSDVRVICATNRQLLDGIRDGSFREDLYYRIACLSVRLPPLRERLEDTELLAACLLEPLARTMNRPLRLTREAVHTLHGHDYPGNIRELRNILFDAAAHSIGPEIDADLIAGALHREDGTGNAHGSAPHDSVPEQQNMPLAGLPSESLREVEAFMIASLLEKYRNSRKKVAAAMGISERTLYRKVKLYGIHT